VIIHFVNQQSDLTLSAKQTRQIVRHVVRAEKQRCNEVSVHFVDTPTICALHQQFFQDPSPTDCISFPMDSKEEDPLAYRVLGDVFVCTATAVAYAQEHSLNPYEETTLYLVHGLLHLMGYDDLHEADCRLMRQAEARAMQELRTLNLVFLELNPL